MLTRRIVWKKQEQGDLGMGEFVSKFRAHDISFSMLFKATPRVQNCFCVTSLGPLKLTDAAVALANAALAVGDDSDKPWGARLMSSPTG